MAKHGHSSKRPSKRSSKKSRKEKHADPKTKAFSGPNRPGPLFPINPHGNKPIEVLIKRRDRLNKFIALREREGSAYNKKVGAK
jgi:hypothetical protein